MCLQRDERGDVGRVNAHAGRDGRVEPKVWLGLGLGLELGSGLGLRPRARVRVRVRVRGSVT